MWLYTDIRYYRENMSEVVPKSEENVSISRKTCLWEKLNLKMPTVIRGAMTAHISGPLPLISIFFSMLLAELKTENGNMMCVSAQQLTRASQAQFGFSSTTRICTRIELNTMAVQIKVTA